nr:hypothetical protein [Caldilineaceae bacterium]
MPSALRWISDLVVVTLLVITMSRMMTFNRIPGALFLIIALSLVGITVAYYESQQGAATAWGWWIMFRYPLLGLFAYLQPKWPKNTAEYFVRLCYGIMFLEIVMQLGQFATGEIPGDDLSGSFGHHGVGELVTLIVLIVSVAWGNWLVDGNWKIAMLITFIGLVSSVLGEIKFYPIAMVVIVFLALALHSWRTGQLSTLVVYSTIIGSFILLFGISYNIFVAEVRGTRPIEDLLNLDSTEAKLNGLEFDADAGIYRFGRGFAVTHGLETILTDPVTALFGMGIGARSESKSLGIRGVSFDRDGYGLTSSPASLVLIQELGLAGIAAVVGFFWWMTFRLLRFGRQRPSPALSTMALGLAIFTFLWPLWIFNHDAWHFSAVQQLYWASIGFTFSQMNQLPNRLSPRFQWQPGGTAQ